MNEDIMKIVRACDAAHLCTNGIGKYPETRHVSNAMNWDATHAPLYFMTARDTPKFDQLSRDAHCCLYYFDDATRHAVRLFGRMEFVTDKKLRHEMWRPEYAKFGYGGPDDDNFILMRFVPDEYKYYVGPELKTGKI